MKRKPRIGWICNSSIGMSETFLTENLDMLMELGEVCAFSGNRSTKGGQADVRQCDFDHVPQKLHHVIRRKLTGRDIRTINKRRRCKTQLLSALERFSPDILWIEFGTTAHVSADLLTCLDKPFVIAVHGFDITREFADSWYQEEFVRLANLSHAVVCASNHTRNLCIAAGVKSEKCRVIRLSLDGTRLQPSDTNETPPASFVHLGRLVEKKGPIQTLLAFKKVAHEIPDATLTFIGAGPLEASLKERIADMGLGDSVRLTGALPQNEAIKLVQEHAIFCQHSVTGKDGDQEGFALSPAEAALLEMPVVSTLHNGIPEHVINGTTGILVREWDIDGMAVAMMELANNPEKAKTMGKAGRQNILSLCDPAVRKANLESLIYSAL